MEVALYFTTEFLEIQEQQTRSTMKYTLVIF